METLILIPSIPNLPLFFSIYLVIYIIAYFVIFPNWNLNIRPEASSCLISLAHGTPAVFLAIRANIFSDPNCNFASINNSYQILVLDYSIAYFLMDLFHYLIFYPSEVLFICHHLATLFVFLTCRYIVHHGAYAILSLLVLAEVTSFCQNTWTLANARKGDSGFAAKVFASLSLPFYVLYSVVRGFLGPILVYQMGVFYLSGVADDVIPRWVWVSWIVVVVIAICVSVLWILNRWTELFRERSGKIDKKLR